MKQYDNEKGIISLTSWKARIDTVYKTIENLLEICPDFHVCLTLSSDEFPLKEEELPENLTNLLDRFELIWCDKNYKAFKKIAFALRKYPGIPVVSADDDCIYTCNYAEELYQEWLKTQAKVIRYTKTQRFVTQGPCTLYCNIQFPVEELRERVIMESRDDYWYPQIMKRNKIKMHYLEHRKPPFWFHDDYKPLTMGQRAKVFYRDCFK